MLAEPGISGLQALFSAIPAELRLNRVTTGFSDSLIYRISSGA